MPRAAATCAICHRQRVRGSHDESGAIFICVQCQADAKQFIEIQDAVWGSADDTDEGAEAPSDQGPDSRASTIAGAGRVAGGNLTPRLSQNRT